MQTVTRKSAAVKKKEEPGRVRIPGPIYRELKAYADLHGMTVAALAVMMATNFLTERGKRAWTTSNKPSRICGS
jgi:hypothetical protein